MSSSPDSVHLIEKLRQADKLRRQVLSVAYERYFVRMICLLEKRLPDHLRRRVDAADLAQSAWHSFLQGLGEGRLDLDGRDSLWPLLARIAICKYHDLVEKSQTQKRDTSREVTFPSLSADGQPWEPPASGPSPMEEAAAAETVDLIASKLRDDRQRQILAMHLGDYPVRAIGEEVKLSESTVKRVLNKIRDLYAEVTGLPALEGP
jgi:RNA polymerase sigma factor (sigma-70 family)